MQTEDQGEHRPAGAPPRKPPLGTRTQQEREASMGQKGKGIGLPAGGETWLANILEWESERGGPRPPEWGKTQRGVAREW